MKHPIRAEFIINGHVQGVGFRYFVYKNAMSLGLKGYAKNQYDGTVLTIAEGEKALVEELRAYLKTGPSRSYVENINAIFGEYTGEFKDFVIR